MMCVILFVICLQLIPTGLHNFSFVYILDCNFDICRAHALCHDRRQSSKQHAGSEERRRPKRARDSDSGRE